MRRSTTSLVLAAVAAGTMTAAAIPASAAAQARDPYAHTRLERVWAGNVCLSMGGSTRNNAPLVVGRCSRTDKTQRWTLKRLHSGQSIFTIKNDKSGRCLAVDSRSHVIQSTCIPQRCRDRAHRWAQPPGHRRARGQRGQLPDHR
ncbi:RICIN domain-containing protein [Streptomyces sp. NPDC001288]|uniref:RICIN domain-containing protein n=1 Tax=unclassified Streptomyces TaxID=2593676 RepID=UPI0033181099